MLVDLSTDSSFTIVLSLLEQEEEAQAVAQHNDPPASLLSLLELVLVELIGQKPPTRSKKPKRLRPLEPFVPIKQ
jgi:hypothetical protein